MSVQRSSGTKLFLELMPNSVCRSSEEFCFVKIKLVNALKSIEKVLQVYCKDILYVSEYS